MTGKVRRFSGGVHDVGLHLVRCPTYRRPVLGGRGAARLDAPVRRKADERGWEIAALDVMSDPVHRFVRHGPKSSAAHVANQVRGFTSRVLRTEFPHFGTQLRTLWPSSHFAASVGAVSADSVRRYIGTQWQRPWRKRTGDGS